MIMLKSVETRKFSCGYRLCFYLVLYVIHLFVKESAAAMYISKNSLEVAALLTVILNLSHYKNIFESFESLPEMYIKYDFFSSTSLAIFNIYHRF